MVVASDLPILRGQLGQLWLLILQAAERDHSQKQDAAAAEAADQQASLSQMESEAAEVRSDLLEAQVENERVMEALRRAGEDKQAQSSASKTLEVIIECKR